MSDPTFTARVKGAGGDALFADLYRRHLRAVRDFCRRRVPGVATDDAVADTFLVAWRRLAGVPAEDDAARVWLYGVADRLIGHQWRSTARRRRLDVHHRDSQRAAAVHR